MCRGEDVWYCLEIIEGTGQKRSSLDELFVIEFVEMELVSYDTCGTVWK